MTQSKAKAKVTSRASKPRKSAAKSPTTAGAKVNAASRFIDKQLRALGGWRADTLAEVQRLIHEADPDIVEERKWVKPTNPAGVPVWSHAGIVCTGEAYQQVVKLTFARGASLKDPQRLFNSSLGGNTRRAIDIREGERLDAKAFKSLIRAAIAENLGSASQPQVSKSRSPKSSSKSLPRAGALPRPKADAKTKAGAQAVKPGQARSGAKTTAVLLSGGNPQIAKADGNAPVRAYIAAMPGWKRDLGKRLDELIVRQVPRVRKAVKWNSPFYGIEGQGWFLSFHVFTHYVKATFFQGKSLRPLPPGGTPKSPLSLGGTPKGNNARWIDIRENDPFDEAQMATWIKQAAALPGWMT